MHEIYSMIIFFVSFFINIINLFLVVKQSKKTKTRTSTKASKSKPEAKKTKWIQHRIMWILT